MRTYVGTIDKHHNLIVTINGKLLDPRLDLAIHCSQGFACGYGGMGAAQLALAILADYLGDASRALAMYDSFKWAVVAKLPREGWCLTSDQIKHAVRAIDSSVSINH
jgi:hypothetical protein